MFNPASSTINQCYTNTPFFAEGITALPVGYLKSHIRVSPTSRNKIGFKSVQNAWPEPYNQLLPVQEGCMQVSMANLSDTWGITSRIGSLALLRGEPEVVCPLRRLCDLGESWEARGDNGGVDPSLNIVGFSDKEVWVGLLWFSGDASPWASWSRAMTWLQNVKYLNSGSKKEELKQ